MAQGGTFTDHGFIPGNVSCTSFNSEFQSAIHHEGFVYVATSDGVWKNNLSTQEWTVSGLQGKIVTAIFKHPEIEGYFMAGVKTDGTTTGKTLYLSTNAGQAWNAAESPVFEPLLDVYENYVCFAVRPGHPEQIFANLEGGATIAISTDYGQTWNRANYETSSYFGYASSIVFNPLNPDKIYQGSENPMDDAWVGTYDINDEDPVLLENYVKLYGIDTWSNRRPMELLTFENTPGAIYVCQEGALSKITDETHQFLYIAHDNTIEKPYTYMEGVWVDPADSQHLLFGGNGHGGYEFLHLYESYSNGAAHHRFDEMFGTTLPFVREIISTDTYPAIIINDEGQGRAKLVMYNPGQLSAPEKSISPTVHIYPNPASQVIIIDYKGSLTGSLDIEMYNMPGQLVYKQKLDSGRGTIDISALQAGMYTISVKTAGELLTEKIIKL